MVPQRRYERQVWRILVIPSIRRLGSSGILTRNASRSRNADHLFIQTLNLIRSVKSSLQGATYGSFIAV